MILLNTFQFIHLIHVILTLNIIVWPKLFKIKIMITMISTMIKVNTMKCWYFIGDLRYRTILIHPLSSFSFQTYIPNLKILFRILNLNSTSRFREVRRVYNLLARKYHPDKWNVEISNISKVESKKRLKRIWNAFENVKLANCLAKLLEKNFLYYE